MSLIISSGTGRKNAVLTMLLCFSLWKRTDYSLRQHQPLYPEKTTDVKAENELYMKKFGRIRLQGDLLTLILRSDKAGKRQTLTETTKTFE